MKSKKGTVFYCFSPPIMLATISVEVFLLIYTTWRYKLTSLTRIVVTLLFFLAFFQLAEYNVCGGDGINAATWSRLGFAAITLLPPLAIHLIQIISKHKWRIITWLAYVTAAIWEYVFLLGNRAFSGHVCAGNYVIFQLNHSYGGWYFAYYYLWLFVGIGLSLYLAYHSKDHNVKKALILQVLGIMVFLLPTTVANSVSVSTVEAIPSIMCGFAVLYALILVLGILPVMNRDTKQLRKHKLLTRH